MKITGIKGVVSPREIKENKNWINDSLTEITVEPEEGELTMKRVENISISGDKKTMNISYNDGTTVTKAYDENNHRAFLKDAIIYHKERINQHTREGNNLFKAFKKLNHGGGYQ